MERFPTQNGAVITNKKHLPVAAASHGLSETFEGLLRDLSHFPLYFLGKVRIRFQTSWMNMKVA
jgi:hypothetical protein